MLDFAKKKDDRFNEAEARTPRIPSPPKTKPNLKAEASMRPRRVRLGYKFTRKNDVVTGEGFNEAEARTPRIRRQLFIVVIFLSELQ